MKILQLLAGLVLAVAGLYIFFGKSGEGEEAILSSLMRELSNTSISALALCAVLSIFVMWLRGLRWHIMLPKCEDGAHKKGLFRIVTIAFMINNILPARLGEAARVVLLWKRNGFPVATSIGSLVVERILDAIVYASFFFVPIFLSPALASRLQNDVHPAAMLFAVGAAVIVALTVGLLIFYVLKPQWFRKTVGKTGKFLPSKISGKGQNIGAQLESNLNWAFSKRKIIQIAFLSYAVAFCYSLMLIVLASQWGTFGIIESMFGQAFASFGAAIPLTPGYVGTLHAALKTGLTLTGIDPTKAMAMAVIYHALPFVTVTAAGLLFLFSFNIKFKDITQKPVGVKSEEG
ncbi:MAG: flippase-like domain-containing protein [Chitinispirillia bacterium]|nr:flippase-like domain-containing protein [Chitinispirillia bacterium]